MAARDNLTPTPSFSGIGYWFNEQAPNAYPRPQALVGRWSAERQRAIVHYLQRGMVFERYRGVSFCRFDCGMSDRSMGNCDLFDGRWVWPQGLAHYVAVHQVRLPEVFIAYAMKHSGAPHSGLIRPRQREGTVDDTLWRQWATKRGATVTLRHWALPSWQQRQRVEQASKRQIVAGHPLWKQQRTLILVHQTRRAAAFLLATKQIAIVTFEPRLSTRIIDGWETWNSTLPTTTR